MLNNQLKSDLYKQQVLPILNTTNLENDISRLKKYLNKNKSIKYMEITLRKKESFSIALELKKYFTDYKFGLGSILTKEDFIKGQDHNFNFYVSPGIIEEILEMKNPFYIPGAETVSEFIHLNKKGYNIIKFFPANLNGEEQKLQSIANILKDIKFIPTGGINKENINKYLDLKNVLCVGTSNFEEF